MRGWRIGLLLGIGLWIVSASVSIGAIERSNAVRYAFAKANTCPSTGKAGLPCPGYVIDHIVPLCAGGADAVGNMQWQTVMNGKLKDAFERRACACLKKAP